MQPICQRHRDAKVAALCAGCRDGLCDNCWSFVANGAPWCGACVDEVGRRAQRAWAMRRDRVRDRVRDGVLCVPSSVGQRRARPVVGRMFDWEIR
jgi:hypothetical protein